MLMVDDEDDDWAPLGPEQLAMRPGEVDAFRPRHQEKMPPSSAKPEPRVGPAPARPLDPLAEQLVRDMQRRLAAAGRSGGPAAAEAAGRRRSKPPGQAYRTLYNGSALEYKASDLADHVLPGSLYSLFTMNMRLNDRRDDSASLHLKADHGKRAMGAPPANSHNSCRSTSEHVRIE